MNMFLDQVASRFDLADDTPFNTGVKEALEVAQQLLDKGVTKIDLSSTLYHILEFPEGFGLSGNTAYIQMGYTAVCNAIDEVTW